MKSENELTYKELKINTKNLGIQMHKSQTKRPYKVKLPDVIHIN